MIFGLAKALWLLKIAQIIRKVFWKILWKVLWLKIQKILWVYWKLSKAPKRYPDISPKRSFKIFFQNIPQKILQMIHQKILQNILQKILQNILS